MHGATVKIKKKYCVVILDAFFLKVSFFRIICRGADP
jgi:hypothetical protein